MATAVTRPRRLKPGHEQLTRSRPVEDVRPLDPGDEVLPGGRAAVAVEGDRAERDRDEQDRSRHPLRACETCEGQPQPDPQLPGGERRDPGDVAEQDRKALAAGRPRLAAEGEHAEERDVRVERDCEGERPGVRRIRVAQLERDEGEERNGTGVATEPLRVGRERSRLTTEPLPRPDEGVCDRAPGTERPPHVPEEKREQREAQPEDHVDPGRREIGERVARADERRGENDDEEDDRERLGDDPDRSQDDPAEGVSERPAGRTACQLRRLPERPQRDERHDEHEGAAPVEQPRRDGEILDPPDPVGQDPWQQIRDQGRTVSCASSTSDGWSSSSKRPGTFATNWITVGTPFFDGLLDVVAVQVHSRAGSRANDDRGRSGPSSPRVG